MHLKHSDAVDARTTSPWASDPPFSIFALPDTENGTEISSHVDHDVPPPRPDEPYSVAEWEAIFDAWVSFSDDPEIQGDGWWNPPDGDRAAVHRTPDPDGTECSDRLSSVSAMDDFDVTQPNQVETSSDDPCPWTDGPINRDIREDEPMRSYLVWEEWEASVQEVMASECNVTEPEILEMVWRVVAAVAFLRRRRYALLTLAADRILLTKGTKKGNAKIGTMAPSARGLRLTSQAGHEDCQSIRSSEMNDLTVLQLAALASITRDLLDRKQPSHQWSDAVRSIPSRLMQTFVDDLIRVSAFPRRGAVSFLTDQDPLFDAVGDPRNLTALAKVANMTAYRRMTLSVARGRL
ncbi:hypothetical protein PISL3812_09906 [Talaromyces islandicus]|uniref:Uncharacterized protein n=1 Tax=Talaromyces islandicus TaxID=28573 RepID=A0A0U1MBA3_TALIS|nr:hypothetical protein PISL3812_09906 [Talaromyces islandicus]